MKAYLKNICVQSIMLKILCSSMKEYLSKYLFSLSLKKNYFHCIISVHQTNKLEYYACRQEKGTVWWKSARISSAHRFILDVYSHVYL